MRLSQYFLPITRDNPKDADTISHRLMLRAGMIHQQAAGIYSWLPIGHRVLTKVTKIIREEQNRAGALELLMPTIQSADLWRESGRYDDYGQEMLRITDRHQRDMLYGPTNEEMITDIFRSHVHSYRELPLNLYHIQWKFRDEIRPRFGVMRGREFLMKDAYSFDLTQDLSVQSYWRMFIAYLRTFWRMGLQAIPVKADSGPIGGTMSHEFVVLATTGESTVYYHRDISTLPIPPADVNFSSDLTPVTKPWTDIYAATDEKHDPHEFSQIPQEMQATARGIEVGHVFYFGTKYSESMGVKIAMPDGTIQVPHMGSYGIGVSRLVAAIIESNHDEHGIVWPQTVTPFMAVIINVHANNSETTALSNLMYEMLQNAGIDILYDNTDTGGGVKFATADLLGIPWQIIISARHANSRLVELKFRKTGQRFVGLSIESALNMISDRTCGNQSP